MDVEVITVSMAGDVARRIFSETKLNSKAQFYQMVTALFFLLPELVDSI